MDISNGKLKKGRRDYSNTRIHESVENNLVADSTSVKTTKRTLEIILDTLQRRDGFELFAEPVDPSEVEDYYEIIKNPMDFGTIRAKLHQDMYHSLNQFQHDVFLIFKNAMHFNSSATVYFKQARILHDTATKVFDAVKTDPHKFEVEFDTTKRRSTRKIYSGDRDSYKRSLPKPPNACERKGLLTRDGSYSTSMLLNVNLQISEEDISYRESLVEFVKDLGPTAKRVAQRKLQEAESSKMKEVIITANPCANNINKTTSSSSRKTHMTRRIMNKKIVLAVPAACNARLYRACRSVTANVRKKEAAVQRPPKQRKTQVNNRSTEAHKFDRANMSWQQLHSSFIGKQCSSFNY